MHWCLDVTTNINYLEVGSRQIEPSLNVILILMYLILEILYWWPHLIKDIIIRECWEWGWGWSSRRQVPTNARPGLVEVEIFQVWRQNNEAREAREVCPTDSDSLYKWTYCCKSYCYGNKISSSSSGRFYDFYNNFADWVSVF